MKECIHAVSYPSRKGLNPSVAAQFGADCAERVSKFHQSFPDYQPTPLVRLDNLSGHLGVAGIYVKDESPRFGLNAFKGLGGSYCLGAYMAQKLGLSMEELSFEFLCRDDIRERLGEITFVTATDGNHGRGVAWAANRLGHKSVVYMPKGSAAERLSNIQALGATASITDMNYDDTVRFAHAQAAKNGWVLVQDTAWSGYEEIPTLIMQGYTTLAQEAAEQLGDDIPTHIFLQAGVGSMAAAIAAFFADYYREKPPIITIIEPSKADCFYQTAKANDGKLHATTGDMDTIMAGLACGEPCTIAWDILRDTAAHYVSMPDYVAAKGMRVLGSPLGADGRIISGESGASTLGFAAEVLENDAYASLREQLSLDAQSKIFCISTEGDTDRANYRRVVWDGLYPSR